MDDNKMLTLVSNERIPLTPSMRMMFEISVRKNENKNKGATAKAGRAEPRPRVQLSLTACFLLYPFRFCSPRVC